jgi:hypothetical protein
MLGGWGVKDVTEVLANGKFPSTVSSVTNSSGNSTIMVR